MKQPSYTCSCYLCKKVTTSLGIDTHFMRSHGTPEQKNMFKNAAIANKLKKEQAEKLYYISPVLCSKCRQALPYSSRNNSFCSRSCAATTSNQKRIEDGYTISKNTKHNISLSITAYNNLLGKINKKKLFNNSVCGPYSKIYFRICKRCNSSFIAKSHKQYCPSCFGKTGRLNDWYAFKFNVFHYPDLFDLSLIKQNGFVSFGGKRGGKLNLHGISRDHKVSVSAAIANNYDPYYITHPLNCELMPHITNNKKKGNCSITYEELVRLVDEYDKIYLGVRDGSRIRITS